MNKHNVVCVFTVTALVLCNAGIALEQGGPEQNALAEVVITAEKRPTTLQKTPAAVLAQSGDELAGQEITDMTTLAKQVPTLVVSSPIGGASIVYLRGVGTFSTGPNIQPGVAFLYDGVYVPREMTYVSLFDVDRIETLLGPQGTLYGRNAAGGIINVATGKPTGRLEGSVLVEGGNYADFHTTDVLNVPVSSTLAVRGAIDYDRHDGYLSNGSNDNKSTAGRLSAVLRPNDDFSLGVSATAYHIGGEGAGLTIRKPGGFSAYTPNPADRYFDPFPTNGFFSDLNGQLISGDATYHFSGASLSYLPAYAHFYNDSLGQNGSAPLGFLVHGHSVSQELRLVSDHGGRSQWLAGVYWYTNPSNFIANLALPGVFFGNPGATFDGRQTISVRTQKSYAAYGQYTYSVIDNVRLTVGARYSRDKLEGAGDQSVLAPGDGTLFSAPFGGRTNDSRFDWRVGIDADVAPNSLLYANVQTGYLPGGFTQLPPSGSVPPTFKPAHLLAYTLGSKNRFFDDRLQINDEAFYYDYRDYQVIYVAVPLNVIINVPKTTIYGNQLDVEYLLTRTTELHVGATYMHSAFGDFINPVAPFQNLNGYQLQQAPSLSGSASLQQQVSLGSRGTLTGRVQSTYNSGYWSTYAHLADTRQDRFIKTDVSLTYTAPNEKWSIAAFGNNLGNKAVYATSTGGAYPDEIISTLEPPRTYGMRITARFH